MKETKVDFSLNKYKTGKYLLVTKDGRDVRLVCTNFRNKSTPIIGVITNQDSLEVAKYYSMNGCCDDDRANLVLIKQVFDNGDIICKRGYIVIFREDIITGYMCHALLSSEGKLEYNIQVSSTDWRLCNYPERIIKALNKAGKKWVKEKLLVMDNHPANGISLTAQYKSLIVRAFASVVFLDLNNFISFDEAEKITERIKDFREFTNTKVSKGDLHKAEVIYKD